MYPLIFKQSSPVPGRLPAKLRASIRFATLTLALALPVPLLAQADNFEDPGDDSTVVYPAAYFADFLPVSANDMINRIPGIGLALRGGNNNGRGLGSGEGEVLINGQRVTGKNSGGRDQLSRIAADQVDYIEIIRGTSEEIDVRGGGQVVNVVLLDTPSLSSTQLELRTDRVQDGTLDPGFQLSHSGQSGRLNYLFNMEASPQYQYSEAQEFSYDPGGKLQETREETNTRDRTEYQFNTNFGYGFENSVVQLNAQYETRGKEDNDRTRSIYDTINDSLRLQVEDNESTRDSWEVGGDYEYSFANNAKFRFLFIVNDRDFVFTRNRLDVEDEQNLPNLYLRNAGRDRERIARSSYTFNIGDTQGLELGAEVAQTIRDNNLRMGLDIAGGTPSPEFGNLVPVVIDNGVSTVEEMRYEPFAIHNLQINERMSLESSLVLEESTISQSGDVNNSRDFQFWRPKLDYRFDITPSFQLRARAELDVEQLSFSDFSATVDGGDEDQNTQGGNPEIRQEQSWRYEVNLEMRLPDDAGVFNSQFWYRDITDLIGRVDVSSGPDNLLSARGNVGDGTRYGVNLDLSTKLAMIGLPNALFNTGIRLRDSEYIDPFLGTKRRQEGNGRWSLNMGYRHDMPEFQMSYGLNYGNNSNGGSGRTQVDIFDTEQRIESPWLSAWVEKRAFGNVQLRLESNNITDNQWCRQRVRYDGRTADGIVEEIENYCNGNGMELRFRVTTTF